MNFEIGDVVWLKTGGPAMNVESIDMISRQVRCTWFTTIAGVPQVQTHAFQVENLTSNDPSPRPRKMGVPAAEPGYKVYEEGDD